MKKLLLILISFLTILGANPTKDIHQHWNREQKKWDAKTLNKPPPSWKEIHERMARWRAENKIQAKLQGN